MLNCFLILIGLFLIVLGLGAIYLGISTCIRVHQLRIAGLTSASTEEQIPLLHGLTDADKPIYFPSKPFHNLACMAGIGALPLSFGILLFVRIAGLI